MPRLPAIAAAVALIAVPAVANARHGGGHGKQAGASRGHTHGHQAGAKRKG